jgi:sorting nexin-29
MREFRISIHLLFVGFKSAYNRTDREQMFVVMNELNIPQKLIRPVRMIMSNMHSQIKIQSKLSAPFIIHKGVQQADALACLLFHITLEYAIRKSGIQTSGTIFYKSDQLMAYADDTVIIGRSFTSMKEGFHLLQEASRDVGLVINEGKPKHTVAANIR